jgi:hypothetical protein
VQIGRLDPEMLGDLGELLTALEPNLAELLADLPHQGLGRIRLPMKLSRRQKHGTLRAAQSRPRHPDAAAFR